MYKVMLVEDEEVILQGIMKIIHWEELSLQVVHKAYDGLEAIKLWEQEEVDIVISDISMPGMNGLDLLKELRSRNEYTRFIILSGYDEFDYARRAIPLDVESYILKPVDDELLTRVLKDTIRKLEELNQKKIETVDEMLLFDQFLNASMNNEESEQCLKKLELSKHWSSFTFAIVKFKSDCLKEDELRIISKYIINERKKDVLRVIITQKDEMLVISSWDSCTITSPCDYFITLQNELENRFSKLTFISVGPVLTKLQDLAKAYHQVKRTQKYIIIEGYGSCIDEAYLLNRKSSDLDYREETLYTLIVKRDKEAAVHYIEDLFINNLNIENSSVDVVYKIAVNLYITLEKIRNEFKIDQGEEKYNIADIIDKVKRAEDIASIKSIFILEVNEIIDVLHTEKTQYSPVIKQILTIVDKDYQKDMSLKTLAGKYNMNVAYLGQMFLKEVGCPFSYYLNNTRCKKGRELILNSNMKINDIANMIGYADISYFYRTFRKYYGVSPASLRELKNY